VSCKKLIVVFNIISVIPGIIFVPLVPFTFILVYGEGKIQGMLHENILKFLLIFYPFLLILCVFYSIRRYKVGDLNGSLILSVVPLLHAILIAAVFIFGGIQLR